MWGSWRKSDNILTFYDLKWDQTVFGSNVYSHMIHVSSAPGSPCPSAPHGGSLILSCRLQEAHLPPTMDETDVERKLFSSHLFLYLLLSTSILFTWWTETILYVLPLFVLLASSFTACVINSISSYFVSFLFIMSLCCVVPLEVTLALLDAANDKDSEVQEQVRKSMLTLGKQQPDRVLAMCQDYLLKHPKVKHQLSMKMYLGNMGLLLTAVISLPTAHYQVESK